jgi:hypothetical protein
MEANASQPVEWMEPLYQQLASAVDARLRCEKDGNTLWVERWTERIAACQDVLPHGSGLDGDVKLDLKRSTGKCLWITTEYHHMDENGYYGGWSAFVVTVRGSMISGIDVDIRGKDRDGTKDYLAELFYCALRQVLPIQLGASERSKT